MPVIDTIYGYQAEDGDFVIVDGNEVQILSEAGDDDNGRWFNAYVFDLDDKEPVYLANDLRYDIWGE